MPRKKKEPGQLGLNSLGDLEIDIMVIVWKRHEQEESSTVKDVF